MAPPEVADAGTRERRAQQWLAGCVLGGIALIVAVLAFDLGSEVLAGAFLLVLVGCAGLVALPAGLAIGQRRLTPGEASVRPPGGALVSGVLLALLGWWVVRGSGVVAGTVVGVALLLGGATAAARASRPLRPPRIRSNAATLAAALFLAFFVGVPERFQGTKPRAYINAMREELEQLVAWQEAYRADSGRYAAAIDSSAWYRASGVNVDVRLTADGYTALVTHEMSLDSCSLYVGSTPLPPARQPGSAWCPAFRNWWLVMAGGSALAALVLAIGVEATASRRASALASTTP